MTTIPFEKKLRVTDAECEETLATIRKTYLDEVEGSDLVIGPLAETGDIAEVVVTQIVRASAPAVRHTHHLLAKGLIKSARRIGGRWCVSPAAALRREFGG